MVDAEAIIAARIGEYLDWHARRAHVPVIQSFRESAAQLRTQELAQAVKRLQRGDSPELVLEQMAVRLTNKFLHGHMGALNRADAESRDALQLAMRQCMAVWEGERETGTASDGLSTNAPEGPDVSE